MTGVGVICRDRVGAYAPSASRLRRLDGRVDGIWGTTSSQARPAVGPTFGCTGHEGTAGSRTTCWTRSAWSFSRCPIGAVPAEVGGGLAEPESCIGGGQS